jgi:hypothetical protein
MDAVTGRWGVVGGKGRGGGGGGAGWDGMRGGGIEWGLRWVMTWIPDRAENGTKN